jgi:flagellar motor switch/type III secretory pathway protein FliN
VNITLPEAECVAAAETPALAFRAPQVEAHEAQWRNALFGAHAQSVIAGEGGRVWRWRPGRRGPATMAELALQAGPLHCVLSIGEDSGTWSDSAIALEPFEGQALCLAAAVRYAPAIAHLQRITGRAWVCLHAARGRLADDDIDPPLRAAAWEVAFEVNAADEEPPALRGHWCIPQSAAEQLTLQGEPPPLGALAPWAVTLDVMLAHSVAAARHDLRRLRPGAAVLLTRGAGEDENRMTCRLQLRGTALEARAVRRGDALHVETGLTAAAPFAQSQRVPTMPSALPAKGDSAADPTVLDQVPITLEFRVGQVTLPLADVTKTLAPGTVLSLDSAAGPETVTVLAQGQPLAVGELVTVGEVLAVRVTRLVAHGPD